MHEYLEKVIESAFKREYEQDESIVRSLPFFAAALGVVVAIFAQIVVRLPEADTWPSIVVGGILILSGVCFGFTLWSLFQVVRVREYKVPPDEIHLRLWADDLTLYFESQGKTREEALKCAESDLRSRMTSAYAEAAVHNRKQNQSKLTHRSLGFLLVVLMLTLASAAAGVIFIEKSFYRAQTLPEAPYELSYPTLPTKARSVGTGTRTEPSTAARTPDADGKAGSEISIHSGS